MKTPIYYSSIYHIKIYYKPSGECLARSEYINEKFSIVNGIFNEVSIYTLIDELIENVITKTYNGHKIRKKDLRIEIS